MNELKCPKCQHVFRVDEGDYALILNQVKNKEFEAELAQRIKELDKTYKAQEETLQLKAQRQYEAELAQQKAILAKKEQELMGLKQQIESLDRAKELEQEAMLAKKEQELLQLRGEIKEAKTQTELTVLQTRQEMQAEMQSKEDALRDLQNKMMLAEKEAEIREQGLKERYEAKLKDSEEQVAYYRDLKLRLSTKMIGESLEEHCKNEFNKIRATAFPSAYFDKDNDASQGTKGDFIYRDFADGIEYISIMFEMKNEQDSTASKHKNEDFLKKLDKDRQEKGCEYAVLVTLLEPENELYNNGIVDVSYLYPKMFVIRPQFFIPLISLLSQVSKKTVTYQRELNEARQQTIDLTMFEQKIDTFKSNFSSHYKQANERFDKALEEIDKTIRSLEKLKSYMVSSQNALRLANKDTDALTIKKLTWGNPGIKKLLAEQTGSAPLPDDED